MKFIEESKPIISIVTVVLNNPQGLKATIDSVINQNFSNFEFIIIDGGSDDRTLNVIKRFDDKINYWLSEKDRGIYDAMNKGIDISRGSIIGILNAGDCYCKDTFTIINNIFKSANRTQVVFGDVIICNQNQDQLYTLSVKKRIFTDGWMPHPGVFVRKEVYEKFGCFDIKLHISADYDFMLRINSKTDKLYVDRPLAKMKMEGVSTSNYLLKSKEDYYARKKNGIPIRGNLLLTILSVVSPILSNFIRVVFEFPEFRFENIAFMSWVRKNRKVLMGNN